ncbi:hypothetical protein ACRRTK_022820 [Alexandromys fortis]
MRKEEDTCLASQISQINPGDQQQRAVTVYTAPLKPESTSTMPMTLGYWDIRGLPYLIDGSTKITQSNAILRYLARKHNLCGETEEERIRIDILENQVMDTRFQLAMVCYSPEFEKQRPEYLAGLPEKLKFYSEFLGKRPWFAGDKITYVDFLAYDILDQQRLFEPKCLEAFPNLKDFVARFEALKKISAYMKSSRFLAGPMYLKIAVWVPQCMSSHVRGILYQIIHKGAGFIGEESAEQVPMATARPWILTLVERSSGGGPFWALFTCQLPAVTCYHKELGPAGNL